jgi:hypothetical protein
MPRYIHEQIQIRLGRDGAAPTAFTWQGRRYAVQRVEACWKAVGPWWDGDGERTFFRVAARLHDLIANCKLQTENGKLSTASDRDPRRPPTTAGIYELCYDHEGERWFLETVED